MAEQYISKESKIAATESRLEKLRQNQGWATAIGAAISGAFGGWEAAGVSARTTVGMMENEYESQLKELGRQESLLEEERRTNAMLANQLRIAKIGIYGDIAKDKGSEEALSTVYGESSGIYNKLITAITGAKNKKQVDQLLAANVSDISKLNQAQLEGLKKIANDQNIILDKNTGVKFSERLGSKVANIKMNYIGANQPESEAYSKARSIALERSKTIKEKESIVSRKRESSKKKVEAEKSKAARENELAISRYLR